MFWLWYGSNTINYVKEHEMIRYSAAPRYVVDRYNIIYNQI